MTYLGWLFFVSGLASLTYQVAWQRIYSLYYGVGSISATIVVSAFMLGLGLGSLIGDRWTRTFKPSLALYVVLEVLIGCFGLVSVPLLIRVGSATAGTSYAVSALYAFALISVPTTLMGMTLPVSIGLLTQARRTTLESVSFFYYANTLGGAVGAAVAGYLIVGWAGLDGAVHVAVALNFGLAAAVLALAYRGRQSLRAIPVVAEVAPRGEALPKWIGPAVFVAGFLAIGYELVWFRIATLLLKDSPYAFSTTLCIYLLGIAFGSFYTHQVITRYRVADLKSTFFALTGGIGLVTLGTLLLIYWATRLPLAQTFMSMLQTGQFMIMPIMPAQASAAAFHLFLQSLVITILIPAAFIAIPAFLMGGIFPVLSSLSARSGMTPTQAATRIYCVLIAGNVLGGILTGFALLPGLGTENTLKIFIAIGLVSLLFCAPVSRRLRGWPGGVLAASMVLLIVAFPGRGDLIKALHRSELDTVLVAEGVDGIVLTEKGGPKIWSYINGSSHGMRPSPSFYVEALTALSYLTRPDEVLIIGLGGASILEAALIDKRVKHITLVELSEPLLRNLDRIDMTQASLRDPRVTVIHDDGRRWLYGHAQMFDAIMIDPLRTSSAYSNNIYSKEFFELMRMRLNPNGVVMIGSDEFVTLPRTIATVFPKVDLHCYFMVARNEQALDAADPAVYEDIRTAFPAETAAAISGVACPHLGDRDFILARHPGAPINTDLHPVTEYYLTSRLRNLIKGIDALNP